MKLTKGQALAKIEELKKYVEAEEVETKEKTVGIAIMSRWAGGKIVFQSSKSTMKEAVVEAVKSGANLYGANLHEADLSGADLYEADLHEADLRRANLYEADLSGANLHEADLSGADLYEADLHEADLRRANLNEADLRGANLRGANLNEADLSGADLHGADLQSAKFYGTTDNPQILKQNQVTDFLAALGFKVED